MSAVDRRVRSRVQPTAALVALLALIPACPSSDVASEGGQVTLDHGLWVGMARGLASGGPVLAGSRVCLDHVTGVSGPKLDGDVLDIDGWWAECVELAVSGPASGEGRCLTFDQGVGEVVVDMTEKTCSVPYLSLADECLAPPAEPTLREATIEARVGDQVATIDLRWTALPSGAEGEFKANPGCPPAEDEGGYGCRGGEGGAPGPAALVLLVLARRRRSGAR